MDNEIYGKLYDIACKNMSDNDMEFQYSREAFMYSAQCVPGKMDVCDTLDMDNMTFLQAAYLGLFYRTVDEGAYNKWNSLKETETIQFRTQLLNGLTRSVEYYDKGVELDNFIYSSHAAANRNMAAPSGAAPLGGGYGNVQKVTNKLYRFYQKLPKFMRSIIKKIFKVS